MLPLACRNIGTSKDLLASKLTHREDRVVEVTGVRVVVALTFLALIPFLAKGRTPWPVLVEVLAVLTVVSPKKVDFFLE